MKSSGSLRTLSSRKRSVCALTPASEGGSAAGGREASPDEASVERPQPPRSRPATASPARKPAGPLVARVVIDHASGARLLRRREKRENVAQRHIVAVDVVTQ